jgi:starvation-inducible DNA-binding protein
MDKLIELMKRAFADTFAMYLKTHNYHWNVEGPDYYQYHILFETIYTEVYGAVDPFAEEIRALDSYAPGSLRRIAELTNIEDDLIIPTAQEMVRKLADANANVIIILKLARDSADALGQNGLVNFLEDRLDNHKKHAWFLRSQSKTEA